MTELNNFTIRNSMSIVHIMYYVNYTMCYSHVKYFLLIFIRNTFMIKMKLTII